jgi:hypothetical protein
LHAREEITYIITDFYNKNNLEKALPIELIDKNHFKYDEKRYSELLSDVYKSISKFFISTRQSFENHLMQEIVDFISTNIMTIFEIPSWTKLGTEGYCNK